MNKIDSVITKYLNLDEAFPFADLIDAIKKDLGNEYSANFNKNLITFSYRGEPFATLDVAKMSNNSLPLTTKNDVVVRYKLIPKVEKLRNILKVFNTQSFRQSAIKYGAVGSFLGSPS